jgi:hypothetical protein
MGAKETGPCLALKMVCGLPPESAGFLLGLNFLPEDGDDILF